MSNHSNHEIITNDLKMKELMQLARTVAQSKATVLIQGESGTGKEKLAAYVHAHSSRASKAFVAINCAAIPENLLESELFGYERGAFTGAVNSKAGKFEFADGGTLLLDEISEMDIRLQAKLLRVIQEGLVDRIGGRAPIRVDVRIIATSNKNLADCVRNGSFREDLFYRLNVVNLTIPPLRERIGDVRILAEYFGRLEASQNGKFFTGLSAEALNRLESHAWNGNVRELEHVIERAVLTMPEGLIRKDDIILARMSQRGGDPIVVAPRAMAPSRVEKAPTRVEDEDLTLLDAQPGGDKLQTWTPGRTLDDIERNVILDALMYHQGNRTHTAKSLGISIRTLRNKLADYRKIGIQV